MKVVGLQILYDFGTRHADVVSILRAWICEVEEAKWQTPNDVKARYGHVSFLADNRIIFDLKGNNYRLEVKVSYKSQVVLVNRIGTHAEYSKWKF